MRNYGLTRKKCTFKREIHAKYKKIFKKIFIFVNAQKPA